MRRAVGGALMVATLVAACADPGLVNQSAAPSALVVQQTQNVPSRAPVPTVPRKSVDIATFVPATRGPTPAATALPDPALLALIPPALGGHALQVYGGRASDIGESGDMCAAYCPGELQGTARLASANPADVTWAVGYVQFGQSSGVLVRAIRVPGARSDLVSAWSSSTSGGEFYTPTTITIQGRRVTLLQSPFPDAYQPVYAAVSGDVLFLVLEVPVASKPEQPSARVIEAFSKLP